MKARAIMSMACLAGLALVLAGCGKKEETSESTPATAQPAAAPVDMATVGSITGSVKFDGVAPKPKKINMASEPACATAHPGGASDQEVVVDAKNDLANVIVYVKDGLGDRAFSTPVTAATIEQKGCMYDPHIVTLMTGQSITVKNADQTTHNIHPTPKNNREWNKSQAPGAPDITDTFAREEVAIPVKCNVHPWMKSYIAVFKHPYFGVSAADGSFTIKDLPPGTYTIEAWHEKYGTADQTVTIGPKETKALAFSFKAAD